MMDLASQMSNVFFSEEHVDGGVETIPVQSEEDMLVGMCYVAECLTFNRQIDLKGFMPEVERARILDVILALLEFN